jgi:hypothetical protein
MCAGVAIPGGKHLPAEASLRAIEEAAKRIRQAPPTTRRRGRTTTPEERALAHRIGATLRKTGVAAKVEVVATVPGKPAKLRIEISVEDLAELRRALGPRAHAKSR